MPQSGLIRNGAPALDPTPHAASEPVAA